MLHFASHAPLPSSHSYLPTNRTVASSSLDPLFAILETMRNGDEAALNALIQRTMRSLRRLAQGITRNDFDTEEVIASVYKRAWSSAAQYDAERGSVYAWLYAMCRSIALDNLRQRKVHHPQRILFAEDAYWAETPDPLTCVERHQHHRVLHRAIEALPSLPQQLIAMAFFRDLSHTEIAAISGIPLGTVKSHLRRALLRLKRSLTSADASPPGVLRSTS